MNNVILSTCTPENDIYIYPLDDTWMIMVYNKQMYHFLKLNFILTSMILNFYFHYALNHGFTFIHSLTFV